jgi:hypothetical protein
VVVQACNLSSQKARQNGHEFQDNLSLHSKTLSHKKKKKNDYQMKETYTHANVFPMLS